MLQVSRPTRLSCFRGAPIPCPLYTEVMPTTNDALKYRHGGRPKGAPLLYCTRHQFPSLAPHAASVRSSTMSHPAGLAPYKVWKGFLLQYGESESSDANGCSPIARSAALSWIATAPTNWPLS